MKGRGRLLVPALASFLDAHTCGVRKAATLAQRRQTPPLHGHKEPRSTAVPLRGLLPLLLALAAVLSATGFGTAGERFPMSVEVGR